MGMRGPPKRPANWKVISGTDRPDRDSIPAVQLPKISEVPLAANAGIWLRKFSGLTQFYAYGAMLTTANDHTLYVKTTSSVVNNGTPRNLAT